MAKKKQVKMNKRAAALNPPQVVLAPVTQVSRKKRRSAGGKGPKSLKLSPGGLAFLKCNTSPADFSASSFQGIPDTFGDRSLVKTHQSVTSIPAFIAGADAYIIQAPIPGIAYLYGSVVAGVLNLNPVYYTDMLSVFPLNKETSNFIKFRYASNVLEIIPTVNAMTWTGSINLIKTNLSLTYASTPADAYQLSGLMDAVNSTRPDMVLPFNAGIYSPTRSNADDYPFVDVRTQQAWADIYPAVSTVATPVTSITFGPIVTTNFTGLGNQECTIIKIPSFSTAGNAATIRSWACVEYQVSSTSALYEYSTLSAPYDPLALQLLKEFYRDHPAGCPYYDNESFWTRLLEWIRRGSGMLSVLPGPVGQVSSGVNLIANAIPL